MKITHYLYNTYLIETGSRKIAIDPGALFLHYFRLTTLIPKLVPRDAQVKVQSESGDVRVSGISGPVDATSDTGVVTLVKISFRNTDEVRVAAR